MVKTLFVDRLFKRIWVATRIQASGIQTWSPHLFHVPSPHAQGEWVGTRIPVEIGIPDCGHASHPRKNSDEVIILYPNPASHSWKYDCTSREESQLSYSNPFGPISGNFQGASSIQIFDESGHAGIEPAVIPTPLLPKFNCIHGVMVGNIITLRLELVNKGSDLLGEAFRVLP